MKPFYVDRIVSGKMTSLLVNDWYYKSWQGCYCLLTDRELWK